MAPIITNNNANLSNDYYPPHIMNKILELLFQIFSILCIISKKT
jgi:hypothetical protein